MKLTRTQLLFVFPNSEDVITCKERFIMSYPKVDVYALVPLKIGISVALLGFPQAVCAGSQQLVPSAQLLVAVTMIYK